MIPVKGGGFLVPLSSFGFQHLKVWHQCLWHKHMWVLTKLQLHACALTWMQVPLPWVWLYIPSTLWSSNSSPSLMNWLSSLVEQWSCSIPIVFKSEYYFGVIPFPIPFPIPFLTIIVNEIRFQDVDGCILPVVEFSLKRIDFSLLRLKLGLKFFTTDTICLQINVAK